MPTGLDAIISNSIITWAELTQACYEAIVNSCCNIDSLSSVPTRLKSGNMRLKVRTDTVGIASSQSTKTFEYYGNGTNPITQVSSSTVSLEWTTFLTAAGIDVRSNKVIQARDLGLTLGLYQQFLSAHLKPVYSRRDVYKNAEAQSLFQATKYITGTITPKYKLAGINPDKFPVITDDDVRSVLDNSVINPNQNWGLLSSNDSPVISRSYLED